jgi:hypothetical protein
MAKIPLPQRGQPIDLTYISDVANAVNNLAAQVSPSSYKYVTIDTDGSKQSVKASEARIIAGYVTVKSGATVSSGNEESFSYSFTGGEFKYVPIVTATPVIVGNATEAGKNVTVVIKNVTTSKVDGIVKFNSSGDLSLAVNLVIIGIPN